jgi:hypothetical protein
MFDSKKSEGNKSDSKKLFSEQSEHIRKKENYFQSKANTLDRKKIIFQANITCSKVRKLF